MRINLSEQPRATPSLLTKKPLSNFSRQELNDLACLVRDESHSRILAESNRLVSDLSPEEKAIGEAYLYVKHGVKPSMSLEILAYELIDALRVEKRTLAAKAMLKQFSAENFVFDHTCYNSCSNGNFYRTD